MQDYIILRKTAASPGGARSVEMFGASAKADLLVTERLSESDAASIEKEPEVDQIAPSMPTRLIEPVAGEAAGEAASWGLTATGAETSPFNGAGVNVAVLDTGIDAAHPAFAGVNLVIKDFSGDGDGDRQGHGTHCAGTVFGRGTTPRIGVAPGVSRALIGKVLRDNGSGDSAMIFRGLQWAADQGANIISMSLGFDFPAMVKRRTDAGYPADLATSDTLEIYRANLRMFDRIMAVLQANAGFGGAPLVIAAAGNASRRRENPEWRIAAGLPAAADGVLSVAALGQHEGAFVVAPFSNSRASLCAPGVDILSAAIGGGLRSLSGTSMACPHVAGLAALWWEAVRKSGITPTPTNVQARLLAALRRERLAPKFLEIDFGQGMAVAPSA